MEGVLETQVRGLCRVAVTLVFGRDPVPEFPVARRLEDVDQDDTAHRFLVVAHEKVDAPVRVDELRDVLLREGRRLLGVIPDRRVVPVSVDEVVVRRFDRPERESLPTQEHSTWHMPPDRQSIAISFGRAASTAGGLMTDTVVHGPWSDTRRTTTRTRQRS